MGRPACRCGAGTCAWTPPVGRRRCACEEEQRKDLEQPGHRLQKRNVGERVAEDEPTVVDGHRQHERVPGDHDDQRGESDEIDDAIAVAGQRVEFRDRGSQG